MRQIFHAVLPIKPQTWKRTEGGRHMPKKQRAYYYELYAELWEAGMRAMDESVELKIYLSFLNSDPQSRDLDNMVKAILDAGQPSNWVNPKKDVGYRDFWDDKQSCGITAQRVRKAYADQITVTIWEV